MWKKIVIDEKNFIIKTSVKEGVYEIILSDLSKVWSEELTETNLLLRCKEMNPLFEADKTILIKNILELINPEKEIVKRELLEVGDQLTVTFSSYPIGIIFKISFILVLTTPEKFCQHLTIPLLQIIEELQTREKALCNLLVKKDVEINEYKMEGVQISRKNVITETFNEVNFLNNSYNETRSSALKCPFQFFEESCGEIYEKCIKRKSPEEVMSPKKEENKEKLETTTTTEKYVKPETSNPKRGKYLEFVDDEEEDDETYFSVKEATKVKQEVKTEFKSAATKKKKRLNL